MPQYICTTGQSYNCYRNHNFELPNLTNMSVTFFQFEISWLFSNNIIAHFFRSSPSALQTLIKLHNTLQDRHVFLFYWWINWFYSEDLPKFTHWTKLNLGMRRGNSTKVSGLIWNGKSVPSAGKKKRKNVTGHSNTCVTSETHVWWEGGEHETGSSLPLSEFRVFTGKPEGPSWQEIAIHP